MPVQGFTSLRSWALGKQSTHGTAVAPSLAVPWGGTLEIDPQWADPEGVDVGSIDPVLAPYRGALDITAPLSGPLDYNRLPLIAADFENDPALAPESFDIIAAFDVFEHLDAPTIIAKLAACSRLLKPGGKACIQSIVIDDSLFERYLQSTDFIQQYIFPGGCLPCPREFRAHAERAGLKVIDELAFGLDYAETLRRWRHQFMTDKAQVLQLGFDERFVRIWEFYLAYCEAAFEQHNTDVLQFTLVKP